MSIFKIFKQHDNIKLVIEPLGNFETSSAEFRARLTFSSKNQVSIEELAIRLKAKPVKKSNDARYLGEAGLDQEIALAPGKSGSLEVAVPVDFSPIDDFDIPPENMAVASPELKAAAAANRTDNYKYSVEVVYKTKDGAEHDESQSVHLIQPDEVRAG